MPQSDFIKEKKVPTLPRKKSKALRVRDDHPTDLHIVQASGVYLEDQMGRQILDLSSGGHVVNCGWNNPTILNGVIQCLQSGPAYVPPESKHPDRLVLASLFDRQLAYTNHTWRYFYGVSRGESMDVGIAAARKFTGRKGVLSFRYSDHGTTMGARAASYQYQDAHFKKLSFPSSDPLGQAQVLRELENLLQSKNKPALLLLESMHPAAGLIYTPDVYFYESLFRTCRQHGVLILADESNLGLYRTGKLFSFQHFNLIPDIIVVGKALGNGVVPISSTLMKQEIGCQIDYHSALGWNSTSVAAALSTLGYLKQHRLGTQSAQKGAYFRDQLNVLKRKYDLISEVRGLGLELGLEFRVADRPLSRHHSSRIQSELLKQKVLAQFCKYHSSTLLITPPLTITLDQIDEGVQAIQRTVELFKV